MNKERKKEGVFGFNEVINVWLKKPYVLLICFGIIGLGLMMFFNEGDGFTREKVPVSEVETTDVTPSRVVEAELEAELTRILGAIQGAGIVRVQITLKSKQRSIWERQSQNNKRVTQEQGTISTEESSNDQLVLATRDGWDQPVLKEVLAPEVQGVIVVAEGAGNGKTREVLTRAVMTWLGIPAHRVMVIPGKKIEEGMK